MVGIFFNRIIKHLVVLKIKSVDLLFRKILLILGGIIGLHNTELIQPELDVMKQVSAVSPLVEASLELAAHRNIASKYILLLEALLTSLVLEKRVPVGSSLTKKFRSIMP